jgi:hypothetical protein
MKRLNAIQSQNLSFFKFFIVALLLVFLVKLGNGIFGGKSNQISRSTPTPPQTGVLTILKR